MNEQPIPTIPLSEARWRLLYVWYGGFALIFVPVIIACFTRKTWDGYEAKIVGWLLPNLVPTLSLIGTVVGTTSLNPERDKTFVRRAFYRFVVVVSLAYIGLVGFTFLIEGAIDDSDLLDVIAISNLWLGPLQGIVAALLAILFFPKSKDDKDNGDPDKE